MAKVADTGIDLKFQCYEKEKAESDFFSDERRMLQCFYKCRDR